MAEFGETLSERELEVMDCLAQGAGNKEIAAELVISQNTVKVHLRNIYTKLGVSSRTEATAVTLQQGIITLPGTPAPIPVETTDSQEDEPDPLPVPAEPDHRRWLNWRTAVILLGALLLFAFVFVLISNRQSATATPNEPSESFEPTDLGENWQMLRPLPNPRTNMATAAIGLNVYAIGGETEGSVTNSVLVYHTTDHTWTEAAAKPTAVTEATAAELFGEIYVPGGRLANGKPTNVVEAYSPTNDSWRMVQSLPKAIAGGLTLTDGSFLYLFGGWDGGAYLDSTYVYDPGENSWRPLPAMSQPRAYLTGGTLTGDLYAVGGYDGREVLAVCAYFDPETAVWSDCPDMLAPRSGAGAASIVNKLYVVGGGKHNDEPLTFSERYDPVGEQWEIVNTPVLADKGVWADLGAVNVETRLFTLGGLQDDAVVADTYLYAPLVFQTFIPAASSGGE